MKLFLVAPLDGFVATGHDARDVADASRLALTMRSRVDYHTAELRQSWTAIDVPTASAAPLLIERAWLVSIRQRSFLAVTVESSGKLSGSLSETEEALSDLVLDFATAHPTVTANPLWVSRTLLLPASGKIPAGWIDGDATTVTLDRSDSDSVELRLGWGNNAIVGWNEDVRPEESHLLLGILDAQYLWVDIEDLSARSSTSIHEIVETAGRKSGSLRRKLLLMEELSTALALHHLAHDELVMRVQGAQRATAVALLKAWNYTDITARITRRIEDTTRVLEQKTSRRERGYQSLVEAILFGLALAAFLELVIVAISTAFEVHASGVEFENSPIGIFPWLQTTDPDYVMGATIIVILVIALLVGVVRLRRR
jgi:hypothetical protein